MPLNCPIFSHGCYVICPLPISLARGLYPEGRQRSVRRQAGTRESFTFVERRSGDDHMTFPYRRFFALLFCVRPPSTTLTSLLTLRIQLPPSSTSCFGSHSRIPHEWIRPMHTFMTPPRPEPPSPLSNSSPRHCVVDKAHRFSLHPARVHNTRILVSESTTMTTSNEYSGSYFLPRLRVPAVVPVAVVSTLEADIDRLVCEKHRRQPPPREPKVNQ